MNDRREHKVGLFRRLFGMDNPESESSNKVEALEENQAGDELLFESSSVHSGVAEIGSRTAADDTSPSPDHPEDFPSVEATAAENVNLWGGLSDTTSRASSPTWEELLNKIILNSPRTTMGKAEPFSPVQNLGQANNARNVNYTSESAKVQNLPWLDDDPKPEVVPWDIAKTEKQAELHGQAEPRHPQVEEKPERLEMKEQVEQSRGKTKKGPIQNGQVIWLLQQAEEMAATGETDRAEKLLEVALTLERHPDVLLALAKLAIVAGNLVKGANFVLKSMEEYPDSLEAVDVLSKIVEVGGALDIDRIAGLRPGTAECCVKLAQLCLANDFLGQSLAFFARAQTLGLNDDDIQFDLGRLYQRMGNTSKAIEHYARDLDLRAELDTANLLFDLYMETELYPEADSLAHKFLVGRHDPEVNQRLARLNFVLGKGLLEKKDPEGALEKFSSALEQGNEDARVWTVKTLQLIAELNRSANPVKTQECLELALKVGGFDFEIAEKLVESHLYSGNDAKALNLLKNLHELEPENTQVTAQLVKVLQKAGELDRAAELLETLASRGQLDGESREQLFGYYRGQGRFEDAKRHLEVLHQRGSESYEAGIRSLVWEEIRYMVEQGDLEKAWEVCRGELRNKPTSDMLGMGMKILTERVDALAAENNVVQALETLSEGQALGLNVLDIGLRKAALYESIGNDRAALNVYEAISIKAPEVWEKIKELYLKAATREYLAGNLTEATRLLEAAYTKLPKNEEICRALGVLYLETGQYGLAAALVQDSMEETEIQVPTDHLNVLRPHGYRRIRLG